MKNIRKQDIKIIHMLTNIIFFILLFFYFINMPDKYFDIYMFKIAIFSLIVFFVNTIFYMKEYKYSLQLIGMNLSMLCFFFGQCYIYLLGEKDLYIFYFSKGNYKLILETFFYSLQFIIVFNIGIGIADKLRRNTKKKEIKSNKIRKLLRYLLIFLILINIIIIMFIIFIFLNGRYYKVSHLSNIEIIFKELRYFFNFYLLFLCVNKKYKNNKYYKLLFLLLASSLFCFGSRSLAVGLLLSYLLYEYIIENKKINVKWILLLLLVIILIPVFSFIRVGERFNIKMLKEIPILLLKELGFSAVPTIIIIKNVPFIKNFEYGKSFCDALARVLRIDRIFYHVNEYGSEVVTKLENMNWGLGYSLVAEGYSNFGKYISVFALIIGIFYGFFLIIKDNENIRGKFITIISIEILYFSVRSDFSYTVLLLFYYVILFKVIISIFMKLEGRNN